MCFEALSEEKSVTFGETEYNLFGTKKTCFLAGKNYEAEAIFRPYGKAGFAPRTESFSTSAQD
jgi:hypothetical protein